MPEAVINYQSPYDANSLINFLKDPVTQAFCWKLTPHPSSVLTQPVGATTHTKDLVLPGHSSVTFRHKGGLIPAAVDTEEGQESAGAEFQAIFDDVVFTRASVNAGDWNGAKLEIFSINYKALDMGQLREYSGRLGTVREEGAGFKAEARHLTAIARLRIGRLDTAACDVRRFLDSRCKKDPTGLIRTGQTVTSVINSQNTFRASALPSPTVAYANGIVKFTSGANNGREFEIKSYDNATKEIILHLDTPFAIAVSDVFQITEGCNRTLAQCVQYANVINYRGLPYITNYEELNRVNRAV